MIRGTTRDRTAIALCAGALAFAIAGCKTERASPDGGGVRAESDARASTAGAGDGGPDEDEVRPVYPIEGVETHPLAAKLCEALHDLPEKRRSACCGEPPGLVVTKECERMLSAAIRARAVELAAADVDRCAEAIGRAYEGCDWVGPFPPDLPAECLSIVKGTLPEKARCRSSLECAGTMRCFGVGPTTAGKCGPARPDGAACGGGADALATFVRQNDVDTTHPECAGYCNRFKCASRGAEGAACAQTRECGAGLQCIGQKCAPRAPSKLGEACPGGVCEKGAQCVGGTSLGGGSTTDRTCVARKPAGAACTNDFDCVGGCIRPDGGAPSKRGRCGMKCGVR
jgi:hypothetical protein